MKEHSLAIPFDIESIQESFFEKLCRKLISLIKAFVRRFIDVIISLFGIILLIPLTIIVFFQNINIKKMDQFFMYKKELVKMEKSSKCTNLEQW